MSMQALEAVLSVLNAALEHVPTGTKKILMANAQGPINELAAAIQKSAHAAPGVDASNPPVNG